MRDLTEAARIVLKGTLSEVIPAQGRSAPDTPDQKTARIVRAAKRRKIEQDAARGKFPKKSKDEAVRNVLEKEYERIGGLSEKEADFLDFVALALKKVLKSKNGKQYISIHDAIEMAFGNEQFNPVKSAGQKTLKKALLILTKEKVSGKLISLMDKEDDPGDKPSSVWTNKKLDITIKLLKKVKFKWRNK